MDSGSIVALAFGLSIVAIPYIWLVVRVSSLAYFQAKMEYQKLLFSKLEKEMYSD